jgi:probable addiction module antidote protein
MQKKSKQMANKLKQRSGHSHDEVVVEMLRADPEFADAYLAAALEETEQPGGHQAMLTALRHIAEAQGMANLAEKAGMPREALYRALGPRGNPTIKTLLAVLNASGLHLSVAKQH